MNNQITYETENAPVKKSKYGRSTMYMLVRAYLDTAGIVIAPGESYNANKISRSLSKILKDCNGDADVAIYRIKEAGAFFNSKNLSWTPEAVWRDWEMIQKWKQKDAGKKIFI